MLVPLFHLQKFLIFNILAPAGSEYLSGPIANSGGDSRRLGLVSGLSDLLRGSKNSAIQMTERDSRERDTPSDSGTRPLSQTSRRSMRHQAIGRRNRARAATTSGRPRTWHTSLKGGAAAESQRKAFKPGYLTSGPLQSYQLISRSRFLATAFFIIDKN
ncbi:hypothetical protein C4553_02745 [Candidatus Parcubacteria bacterium]|nr:MAG: hypothetical protein C4553_02745 [Candidatus Parcubacteria bacterium]